MQRISAVHRHCRAEFQFAIQPAQVGHAFITHPTPAAVFVFVQALALQTGVKAIHQSLLGV
jgi:hypothetical protein